MLFKKKVNFRRGIFRPPIQAYEPIKTRVNTYLSLQKEALNTSFVRLWVTPIGSILTILVLAMALALPVSLHGLVENAQKPLQALETTSQISLFLKPELNNESGRRLVEMLKRNPKVSKAELITKEQGLVELSELSGFADALSVLANNPLPVVALIKPEKTDVSSVSQLLQELRKLPEADLAQFDTEWLNKLRLILEIAEQCVTAFSLLLGIGVIFIVGNTIRLELQTRHEEIAVQKLLGATNQFIRRPFLHAGLWYALLGSILALFLANAIILAVRDPANQLASLYGSTYQLSFIDLRASLLMTLTAVLLGISGAWIVVSYYLRKLDPAKGTKH